jgi:hypothetical protein
VKKRATYAREGVPQVWLLEGRDCLNAGSEDPASISYFFRSFARAR